MKANIYYVIHCQGGSEKRCETKEEAQKVWESVCKVMGEWCEKHEDPDCENLLNWIPSLKHRIVNNPTEKDFELSSDFIYEFDHATNGYDQHEVMKHTLRTYVEVA